MRKVLEQPQAAAQETSGAALPLEDDAALQEVEAQLALEEDADMETYGMVSDGSNVANGSMASETNETQDAARDQINVIKQLYAFHVLIMVSNSGLGVLI